MRTLIAFVFSVSAVEILLLLLTLIFRFRGKIEFRIKTQSGKHELNIYTGRSAFPVCFKMKIRVKNLYTGESCEAVTRRIVIGSESPYTLVFSDISCGRISIVSDGVKVGFIGSLWLKNSRRTISNDFLIMPGEDFSGSGLISVMDLKSGKLDDLISGCREYVRGDRLADIHMKLSAKCGKYMVRERGSATDEVRVSFLYHKDAETAVKNAELLLYVVDFFLSAGNDVLVLFGGGSVSVCDKSEICRAFEKIFSETVRSVSDSGSADIIISEGRLTI